MNNVTLKIAFSSGHEYLFAANELPKSLIACHEFNLGDFDSLEALNIAINEKEAEAYEKNNGHVSKHYIDITPFPNPRGFFPTGGVRWAEKAWGIQEYLNNEPSANTHKKGDRVVFKNGYGVEMEKTIFGFDSDGEAILKWDCYWVSKPLEKLAVQKAA